jgi:hypothetical protein
MRARIGAVAACAAVLAAAIPCGAADNELSPAERQRGWQLLFDGKTLKGWTTSALKPSNTPVEDGRLNPHGCGGYMLVHEKQWGDFVLSMDFRMSRRCNNGIFVRTSPLRPDSDGEVGWNGLEIAIDDTKGAGYHDTGAIYDLVAPTRNAMRPAGEWNHIEITCDRATIRVALNGEAVTRMDLREWTEPNKRPDGTAHKFPRA